jgi:hypothetical protein
VEAFAQNEVDRYRGSLREALVHKLERKCFMRRTEIVSESCTLLSCRESLERILLIRNRFMKSDLMRLTLRGQEIRQISKCWVVHLLAIAYKQSTTIWRS